MSSVRAEPDPGRGCSSSWMASASVRPCSEIGERLAKNGYFVLLPDLFYRSGPYEPMDAKTVFSDPEKRKVLMEKSSPWRRRRNHVRHGRFLDWLAAQPDVKPGGIGTTGYCMGGLMSLTAAGTYPDRIVAAASYHGGRLATDAPESPHLLAPRMKARVYVAGAIEDAVVPRRHEGEARGRAHEGGSRSRHRDLSREARLGAARYGRRTMPRARSVTGRRCSRSSTRS